MMLPSTTMIIATARQWGTPCSSLDDATGRWRCRIEGEDYSDESNYVIHFYIFLIHLEFLGDVGGLFVVFQERT